MNFRKWLIKILKLSVLLIPFKLINKKLICPKSFFLKTLSYNLMKISLESTLFGNGRQLEARCWSIFDAHSWIPQWFFIRDDLRLFNSSVHLLRHFQIVFFSLRSSSISPLDKLCDFPEPSDKPKINKINLKVKKYSLRT